MRQLQREHEADKGAANHAHGPPRLAGEALPVRPDIAEGPDPAGERPRLGGVSEPPPKDDAGWRKPRVTLFGPLRSHRAWRHRGEAPARSRLPMPTPLSLSDEELSLLRSLA